MRLRENCETDCFVKNSLYHSGMTDPSCTLGETCDPRVVRTREMVLAAAADLLDEGGWDAVTHSSVSVRSGIGRTTLYRHWHDKVSLLGDAIKARIDADLPVPTGDLRADLLSHLEQFRRALASPTKRSSMCAVLAEAEHSEQFRSLRRAVTTVATSGVTSALKAGKACGQLPEDLDLDLTVEQLVGPMMFRGLMWHRPVTRAMTERLVDDFLASAAR